MVCETPFPPGLPGKEQVEGAARRAAAGKAVWVTASESMTPYVPNATDLVKAL